MQTIGLFTQTSNKLIIVRRAQDLKEVEPLFSELQSSFTTKTSNSSNVLILIAESLDLRKKFHQWLKKEGYAIEFKADKGSQLTPWIQYIAKKKGLELSDDAFPFLALICEGSLHHLSQELEKAALYVGINSETTITKETIARVCSGSASFSLSELVAYVLNSDKYKALLLVQKLIREPDEALGFLGLLTWYLKRQTATIPLAFILDLIELDEKLKSTGLPAKLLIEQFVSNLLENSPLLQNHENV
jgi:DNA polymerase III delta subunit